MAYKISLGDPGKQLAQCLYRQNDDMILIFNLYSKANIQKSEQNHTDVIFYLQFFFLTKPCMWTMLKIDIIRIASQHTINTKLVIFFLLYCSAGHS